MKHITAAVITMVALAACAVDAPGESRVETGLEADLTSEAEPVVTDADAETLPEVDADADADADPDADASVGSNTKKCQVIDRECTCPAPDTGWKLQRGLCYEPLLTCGRQGFCTYVRDI